MDIEQSVVENLRKSVNNNSVNSQKENEGVNENTMKPINGFIEVNKIIKTKTNVNVLMFLKDMLNFLSIFLKLYLLLSLMQKFVDLLQKVLSILYLQEMKLRLNVLMLNFFGISLL